MMRKLIVGTILLVFIGSFGSFAYANPDIGTLAAEKTTEQVQEAKPFFRLTNLSRNMITSDPNLFISFSASEKSTVTISVYHNTSLSNDEQKFALIDEPFSIDVGTIQRGFTEVLLKKGTNRIHFKINFEKGEELIVTRTVTVKDIEEVKRQLTENILNSRDSITNIFIATENYKPQPTE